MWDWFKNVCYLEQVKSFGILADCNTTRMHVKWYRLQSVRGSFMGYTTWVDIQKKTYG